MKTIYQSLILTGLSLSLMSSAQADNQYGLKENIQEGVILHCFDWTAAQVEAELTNIAAAGFTAVQLSPVHQREGASAWYMAYQPYDFYVGNSIASVASLTSLCTAAHELGVKVIVDVIANHTNGNLTYVADRLKDASLYHNDASTLNEINYGSRSSIINDDMGIQDLDTNNKTVQSYIKTYIAELKSCGVDGIRFDAAKHIGLPSEGDSFWQNVPDQTMYNYGEILDSTGGDDTKLFPEYQTYISITDNTYGNGLANSFNSGNVPSSIGVFNQRGAASSKLVYWGESHDTYSNDNGESKYKSQNVIDRAYAIAAGNNGATALYFSRPFETNKHSIKMAVKGSTHFTAPEVAEVNHCHNLCAGEPNYYVHTDKVGAQVRQSGCIMAVGNGQAQDVSFANGDGKGGWLAAGTYTDRVAGGTFTVTAATISGHVGSTGIAVIYDGTVIPTPTPTPTPTPVYEPTVTAGEISCFYEGNAEAVSIWVWDATNRTNYTGGAWATKPNMELMGVNASGTKIFKWTYDGALTAVPEKVIFVADGSQSADLNFTNHGYYINNKVDHVVAAAEQPTISYSLACADATAKQGETVSLTLNLDYQNITPVGLQCLITLPAGVTSGEEGLLNVQAAAARCNGHTIQTSRTQSGYALTLLDKANAAIEGNEGAIATFDVVVSSAATLGDLTVSVSDLTLTTVNAANQVTVYQKSDAVTSLLTVTQGSVNPYSQQIQALRNLVSTATTTYQNSVEGTAVGQYEAGSRATLYNVIQDVNGQISDDMELTVIEQLTRRINTAVELFETKKVTQIQVVDTDLTQYADVIYAQSFEARPGAEILLPVVLKNSDFVVSAFQTDIFLPNGFTIVQKADQSYDVTLNEERIAAKEVQTFGSNIISSGAIRLLFGAKSGKAISGNDGTIATIRVKVASDVQPGSYAMMVKKTTLNHTEADGITVEEKKVSDVITTHATINVLGDLKYVSGDLNNDNEVDFVDLTLIEGYILEYEISEFNREAADMNGDSVINVTDWTILCNTILNAPSSQKSAQQRQSSVGRVSLFLADAEVSRDGETEVALCLTNQSDLVASYQVDLALPQGITLTAARTAAQRCTDQQVLYNQLSNGSTRLLVTSQSDAPLQGTQGTVLYLTLRADAEVTEGRYGLPLFNGCLTQSGSALHADASLSTLTVAAPAGIESLSYEDVTTEAIYDLQGMRQAEMGRGIQIIRNANGTTRKIQIK